MSRLIVKGLPKYFTEDKLRDHFGKQGNVTDVKLMKKRNGESRRFAFIGYKSYDDAENAAKFFNSSYIDTARIDVELAKTFSDPNVPLPMKEKRRLADERLRNHEEYLLEQEEKQRQYKRQRFGRQHLDDEIQSNPKLREFIEVMKPSHQVKSWANDVVADGSGAPSSKALEEALAKQDNPVEPETVPVVYQDRKEQDVAYAKDEESDNEYDDFKTTTHRDQNENEDEEDEPMMSLNDLAPVNESNDNIETNVAVDENMTDLDWLKQRRIRMKDNEVSEPKEQQKSEPKEEHTHREEPTQTIQQPYIPEEPKETPEEITARKISETGRLFIRNILYTSTEKDFRELFETYGNLEEVHIAIDTRTGKSKGFVYVQFSKADDAVSAFQALDKEIFQGRLLHILPGEKKKDHRLDEFDLKNLPLKKQRELKKKAQASKTQFSWNSLYMNSDAVLDSVAAKMGIAKSQLINPENSNSAVKQALAEAHVIGDVRKYFEDRGVDLTLFDKSERDDKVILVKNFPFGTSNEEIGDLFREFGELKRILMPPAGIIAIVEFRDSPSARAAFTKLSYRRFKKSIIYLEKGPKGLFNREPRGDELVGNKTKEESNEEKAVEAKLTASEVMGTDQSKSSSNNNKEEENDSVEGPTVSIFVKNLNFSTTSLKLSELFQSLPGFVVAVVKTKPDPKNAGGVLSMGFGFVEFRTKEQANIAISTMDNNVLDGHKIQLKLSHRTGGSNKDNGDSKKSNKTNKIIVKNLPFEASRKDVLELFGSFGQLKSVRVPKKFDKSARGFAFVEFTLLKEAENAMNQLEGVHLLGRRLVMQYAEKDADNVDDEIDKMTRKVKKQVATTQLASARLAGKGKFDLGNDENEDEFGFE